MGSHAKLTMLPIEPIREAMLAYLKSYQPSQTNTVTDHGFTHLGMQIWGDGASKQTAERSTRRLLKEGQMISFDLADRILVALDRVDLWHTDPVLAAYYERVVAATSLADDRHVSARAAKIKM